ncbi:MAG: ArsR/SmtB family transcription factor [Thermincolia bacterium]
MSKTDDVCEINCLHEEAVNLVRKEMINEKTAGLLADVFKAMGDITRIKIINGLSRSELCVCDIAFLLGMSQSAISHQLRVLRSLKLVKYRKEGRVVYYSLDDDHIVNLFAQGLEHVKEGNR